MKLYGYWRSTTSYRVRIALALKGVDYTSAPVDLAAGAHHATDYLEVNPSAGVPALVLGDGTVLTQSMAILDWLEVVCPFPPLLPADPIAAAHVRAAALVIACDVHPVNNLRIGARLREMGHGQDDVVRWMNDWMTRGFSAYQALLPEGAAFSFGDAPSVADICLVPQLYNAHRWDCDLGPFPRLTEIEARCLELPAFDAARPENQPDAPNKERKT